MLTRREVIALCLAASTAPVITCVVSGSTRVWSITAAVAYLAALAIGTPLFAYLRHRRWPLASRSLAAAAFTDPQRVIADDTSHSSREQRYFCFGAIGGGVLTVRFTYRAGIIRIFSAGYWRRGKQLYERENQIHR